MTFRFQFARPFVLMHRVCCLFLLVIAAGLVSPLLAEEPESLEDSMRDALVRLVDNVHSARLSNGLRVLLYRRGVAPVFGGAVVVRVGGVDEVPGATGISHLLEHMAFKGTPTIGTKNYERERELLAELETLASIDPTLQGLSPEQRAEWERIQSELEELWVTGDFTQAYNERGAEGMNATTGKELTSYFVKMPVPAFEFWAWIESERILRPVMRQFYRERDVVMEERRMRYDNSPGGALYEKLLGVAFLVHPYRNPVIGYPHDLNRLTATEVKKFHERYYVAENIVVSVVGDIAPEEALPVLERYFGRIPARGEAVPHDAPEEPEQTGERQVEIRFDASPELAIAYHKRQYPHPDDPAISVMLEILSGSRISPLYDELVRRRRLVTDIGHFEAPGSAFDNLMIFSATPRSPHGNREVVRAFDRVIERFKRGRITESQVEIAKRSLARSYIDGIRSYTSLATDLASSELLFGDWRSLLNWYDLVMQVTPADVKRVANEYLVPQQRTVGTVERKK